MRCLLSLFVFYLQNNFWAILNINWKYHRLSLFCYWLHIQGFVFNQSSVKTRRAKRLLGWCIFEFFFQFESAAFFKKKRFKKICIPTNVLPFLFIVRALINDWYKDIMLILNIMNQIAYFLDTKFLPKSCFVSSILY